MVKAIAEWSRLVSDGRVSGKLTDMSSASAFVAPRNPFTPGFGQPPRTLVGRDEMLSEIQATLATGPSDPRFTLLILGQRGSGKTVLLDQIEAFVEASGGIVLSLEPASRGGLQRQIIARVAAAYSAYEGASSASPEASERRRLTGLRVAGVGASWQPPASPRSFWEARDYLTELASYAASRETLVLLSIDEFHSVNRADGRQLAQDIQRITKRSGLPLAFIAAGLAEMAYTLLSDKKMTFFQRCERRDMPPLTRIDAWRCLRETIRSAGGTITEDALSTAASAAGGLPYRLQLIGAHAWSAAGAPAGGIDAACVRQAVRQADEDVHHKVVVPAWHDLTEHDRFYLRAVAELGPAATRKEIARAMPKVSRYSLYGCERRLEAAGHIAVTSAGAIRTVGVLSVEAVKHLSTAEIGYDTDTAGLVAAPSEGRCPKWMPRAKQRCALTAGHKGACRTRR